MMIAAAHRDAQTAQTKVEESRRRARVAEHGDVQTRFDGASQAPLLQEGARLSDELAAPRTIGRCRASISMPDQLPSVVKQNSLMSHVRVRKTISLESFPQGGEEWRWLSTLSFFVGATFSIGAALFTVGAFTSVRAGFGHPVTDWQETILVSYAYLLGHMYFVAGAYLGWYEVINVGQQERRWWARPDEGQSSTGYWGALLYFLGTLPFQVSTTMGVLAPGATGAWLVFGSWATQAVGSACYTAAALLEFRHNHDARCDQRIFWLCALYLLGSALFLLAASVGTAAAACEWLLGAACALDAQWLELWAVDLPYLLGSMAFLVGAWLQIQMWKGEQFGLGFIRDLNPLYLKTGGREMGATALWTPPTMTTCTASVDDKEGYAGAWSQQLMLAVYMGNAVLATINVALNRGWHEHAAASGYSVETSAEELVADGIAWVAAHGMLLTYTVVHFTPSLHPYDYLLQLMRGVATLFLIDSAMRCARYVASGGLVAAATCNATIASVELAGPGYALGAEGLEQPL